MELTSICGELILTVIVRNPSVLIVWYTPLDRMSLKRSLVGHYVYSTKT